MRLKVEAGAESPRLFESPKLGYENSNEVERDESEDQVDSESEG